MRGYRTVSRKGARTSATTRLFTRTSVPSTLKGWKPSAWSPQPTTVAHRDAESAAEMADGTTVRVLLHMATSSRIFLLPRRPRLRYTRPRGRSSLRSSQGRYLVRLELVASAVLLGVAALWSAVRGLDLAAAVRPSLAALAVGAACGLGLAASLPLVTAPWAHRMLLLPGLRRAWDSFEPDLRPRPA